MAYTYTATGMQYNSLYKSHVHGSTNRAHYI